MPPDTHDPEGAAGRAPGRAVRPGRIVLPVVLAALAAPACGGGSSADGQDAFTARDSAGVRIVEADWDRLPVLDTVDAGPVFTVGGTGDLALNRVRAARLLPDGRVAVGFGASPEVVVVDTADGEITTVATPGDGPSELGSVASLHVEAGGERLGVYDPRRRRYVVFTSDGELIDERSVRDVWPGRGGPAVTMWGPPAYLPMAGDTFFVGAKADVPEAEGISRAELPLLRVRGGRVDTVTRYRGHEFFRSGRDLGPVLLGARVGFAASPAGVWIADTGSPSVARWSAPGPPELVVRWSRDLDRSLTEDDVQSVVDRIMDQVPPSQRQGARQYVDKLPVPDRRPAYGDVLVDDQGVLWVGEPYGVENPQIRDLPDEWREWELFAPDGTPRGRVVTAPRVEVVDVRGDRVLGVHRNELGVETVRVYRVER